MVDFAESVTVFDADNQSRELPLHPDGKFYDAKDNQDTLSSESMHLEEDPSFMDAYSDIPMSDGFDHMMSFSALNKSAGDLWDSSFDSFASEGSASVSQFQDAPATMENSMSLQDIPLLVNEAEGSDGSLGSSPKKEEEPEEATRQVAKQMGYALMLQGGMYFAMGPLMQLGKRLFRSENNEEDVVEDAAAAQTMVNRSGQIQHGMLNRGGDVSTFAQAGAHESSRNMAGAFVIQKDVTAQVMKQAMIQAAQTAGASVGQGAATMTIAASAGAAASGATAIAAGGAAAATMSAKFAIGVALGSVIAAGGLGGATLGSYMVEEELTMNVPKPIFANNDLVSYKFDTVDLASGIAPTVSPESFYEELGSLGFEPTASPGADLSYGSRSPTLIPGSVPTTVYKPDGSLESPALTPSTGTIGVPTSLIRNPSTGATSYPLSWPTLETPAATIPAALPIALSTETPAAGLIPTAQAEGQMPGATFGPATQIVDGPTSTGATTGPTAAIGGPSLPTGGSPAVPDFPTLFGPTASPILGSPTVSSPTTPAIPTNAPIVDSSGGATSSPIVSPTSSVTNAPVATPVGSPIAAPDPANPVASPVSNPVPNPVPSPVMSPAANPVASPVSNPVPVPSPVPDPVPSPVTSPVPDPVPSPVTSPVPDPVPSPVTSPVPDPVPSPVTSPVPDPVPSPVASPVPDPVPSPVTSPVPDPVPSPLASPVPDPVPSPVTSPVPDPVPSPVTSPVPDPVPSPVTSPVPDPVPSPVASPVPDPVPSPVTSPVPDPVPSPVASPVPDPVPSPVTSPVPDPVPSPVTSPVPDPVPSPVTSPVADPVPSPVTPPNPPSPVTSPVPPTPAPTMALPVGSITGWSLVNGVGTVLIASLTEGQTISKTTYGTDLKVQANVLSTVANPVGSISFAVFNNAGGGSFTIWDKAAPFQTSSNFLNYPSVKIKGTPLPSSTNQGNKGTAVELNLIIVD